MSDFDFGSAEIKRGLWAQAVVKSVCSPLVGKEYLRGNQLDMVEVVQSRWRQALAELRDAGWTPVQDPRRFQYARNCPSPLLRLASPMRYCTFSHLCPHCLSRELVIPAYNRFLHACFDPRSGHVRPRLSLVALERKVHYDRKLFHDVLQRVAAQLQGSEHPQNRRSDVDRMAPSGALVVHLLYPEQPCWVYCRRVLTVTKNPYVPEDIQGDGVTHDVFTIHTRKDLVLLIAKTCRYPVQWLTCTPEDRLAYLKNFERVRLFDFYGSLRVRRAD